MHRCSKESAFMFRVVFISPGFLESTMTINSLQVSCVKEPKVDDKQSSCHSEELIIKYDNNDESI